MPQSHPTLPLRAVVPSWIPLYTQILSVCVRRGWTDPDEAVEELAGISRRSVSVEIRKSDGTWRSLRKPAWTPPHV